MKRKIVMLHTTIMLGIGSVAASPVVHAQSVHEMKEKKEAIQKERTEAQSSILLADQEITRLQDEQQKMLEQVKRLDLAFQENSAKVQETQKAINKMSADIASMESDIAVLKAQFAKRHELLKERVRSFQESGGSVNYLEVLLGASSFGDFIERAVAVTTIAKADQEILKQTQEDQQNLEEKQMALKTKLADLESMKTELDGMMAQLTEQKAQKDQFINELKEKEKQQAALKANLEQTAGTLALQESAIEEKIKQELARSIELEAAKRQAAKTAMNESDVVVNTSGSIQDVITVGNRWIGNSAYVFGGGRNQYDIANGLFDCSAFVHWAFSQVGVKLGPLGSVSTETLKHVGKSVSVSDMQPGDLVFFDTYKKDGHVGIYVGNGRFIGSQSSTGVAVADMTTGYWKQTFNGRVKRL